MTPTYNHLYCLTATGLRFCSEYGPWGRPDMAPMLFAKAILAGEPIRVFNNGQAQRNYTYINDIVKGVVRVKRTHAKVSSEFDKNRTDPATSITPHRMFNFGNINPPIALMKFIECLDESLGIEAIKQFKPKKPGDVKATTANTATLNEWMGFKPSTPTEQGVGTFARWCRNHQQL